MLVQINYIFSAERLNIPIASADDLIKQSKIKYGFKAGGSTDEFFKVITPFIDILV
jgi:hypothetical protein